MLAIACALIFVVCGAAAAAQILRSVRRFGPDVMRLRASQKTQPSMLVLNWQIIAAGELGLTAQPSHRIKLACRRSGHLAQALSWHDLHHGLAA
jgi:hypothetical protein